MRLRALFIVAVSSFALASCAHKPKPQLPPEDISAPPPAPVANDGTDRIDPTQAPPPRKKGFFSKLSNKMGGNSDVANAGPCPSVRVLYEASRFVEIDGPEKFENIGYTGEIQNVTSSCRYYGDTPIDVGLQIDMAIGKGPKATGDYKDVKYWVSVVRTDIAPISKQEFTSRVYFKPGQDRDRLLTPPISISIPRASSGISGTNFEVIIGYDLTPEQLEFNRDGKRFRIDSGIKK